MRQNRYRVPGRIGAHVRVRVEVSKPLQPILKRFGYKPFQKLSVPITLASLAPSQERLIFYPANPLYDGQ
jgi:hypothetical protein